MHQIASHYITTAHERSDYCRRQRGLRDGDPAEPSLSIFCLLLDSLRLHFRFLAFSIFEGEYNAGPRQRQWKCTSTRSIDMPGT